MSNPQAQRISAPSHRLAASSLQTLLESLLHDQRERHTRGDALAVEAYLEMCPLLLAQPDALSELIGNDIDLRRQRGEEPTLGEYADRFPTIADRLKSKFEASPELPTVDYRNDSSSLTGLWNGPGVDSPDPDGISIPGYVVLELLGRGGMGVVYRARHRALDRVVALKMIRSGDRADADQLARFNREAEVIARLQHPNIVQIFEVGLHNRLPFISLEYCAGGSLHQRLRESLLTPLEAAAFLERLANAVHAAHEKGVLHRDLKPANVLLHEDGTPKIADFGLAKRLDEAGQTQTGVVMGTPSYMPPEQTSAGSESVGPTADVYSLGAILYECLTGRPPFKAASAVDTILQVLKDEPIAPRQINPKLPRDLETICLKCLRKPTAERYETARALAEDLDRFQKGQPIVARPVGRVERTAKWVRRNPARAALSVVSLLALASLTAAIVAIAFQANLRSLNDQLVASAENEKDARIEAIDQRDLAKKAEAAESVQRERAETAQGEAERLRTLANRIQFASDMGAAHLAWDESNVPRMLSLLEQHRSRTDENDFRSFEWHYLNGQSRGEEYRLAARDPMAFSPDGKYLVAGVRETDSSGSKGNVTFPMRVFDVANGRAIRTIPGSELPWMSVAFLDGGRSIVLLDMLNVARIFDVASGDLTTVRAEREGAVNSTVLSPDGKTVACTYASNEALVWDLQSGKTLWTMKKDYNQPTAGIFRPGGKELFWGTFARTDRRDMETGKILSTFKGKGLAFRCRAFSPDGQLFVSGSTDGNVTFYDADSGKELRKFEAHSNGVLCCVFSPDGKQLATGGGDNRVVLWDVASGKLVREFRGHARAGALEGVVLLAFHPDGIHLASQGFDETIRMWDTSRDLACRTLAPHTQNINALAFSPDNSILASGSWDGTVNLWDGENSRLFKPHSGMVYSVDFSPDGQHLLTGGADDFSDGGGHSIRVWNLKTLESVHHLQQHGSLVYNLAYSPDGKQFASAMFEGIKLFDSASGKLLHTFPCNQWGAYCVAFHPHKPILAAGSKLKLHFFDLETKTQLRELDASPMSFALQYSHDGNFIAQAGEIGSINVWDSATGKLHVKLDGHNGIVHGIAFSPDGRRLISGGADRSVRLWDLATGRETMRLMGHEQAVHSVTMTSDGKRLASADIKDVKIWDATKSYDLEKTPRQQSSPPSDSGK